jgi:hypothetical protein
MVELPELFAAENDCHLSRRHSRTGRLDAKKQSREDTKTRRLSRHCFAVSDGVAVPTVVAELSVSFHQLEQSCAVVQIDTRTQPSPGECRELPVRDHFGRASPAEKLAQRCRASRVSSTIGSST